MSSKLFTLVLKDVFEKLNWCDKDILINGKNLNHLRYVDDIVLISESKEEIEEMLLELEEESQVGLMNFEKTKTMSKSNCKTYIKYQIIENVEKS